MTPTLRGRMHWFVGSVLDAERLPRILLHTCSSDAKISRSSPIRVTSQVKKARQERQLPTGRMSDL